MKKKFSASQRMLLTVCVVLYTAAYFCRLNLSAALDGIMRATALPISRAGFLQTVFALVYAAGQLVNGAVVDRVNPVRYMLVGITGSALCNLAMGMTNAYPAMLAVWAANAAFQSMLWTPVMRIIALHFRDPDLRLNANAAIALALTFGHLGAWAVSGYLASLLSWRFSFFVPGVLALVSALFAGASLRGVTSRGEAGESAPEKTAQRGEPILRILAGTGFFFVLISCLLYGFIRDGVVTWTPTLLSRLSGSSISSTAFTLILPLLNSAGVIVGFSLRKRGSNPHSVVVRMMAAAIVCSAALLLRQGMLLTALLLGLICAAMYGANTMLTGLIPLEFDPVGKTGLTAGLVDSLIYAGSALAGAAGGSLYETLGAPALYASWIAAAVVSGVLMCLSGKLSARYWRSTN